MKTASAALISYLNGIRAQTDATMIMADAFLFTLRDGTVLAYTNADVPFAFNGNTYLANSVRIDGLKYKSTVGLSVDQQSVTASALSTDTVNGAPFLQALRNGAFDGCEVARYRVFFTSLAVSLAMTFVDDGAVNVAATVFVDDGLVTDQAMSQLDDGPLTPVQAVDGVLLFKGRVGTIDSIGRTTAKMTVNSDLVLLDIDMPKNVYQATCLHTLYDKGCTLTKATFGTNGIVAAGSTASVINWAGASANFAQGSITFTSGANANVSATVVSVVAGKSLTLAYPLETTPSAGDSFTVYFGCDHTEATCKNKFNNVANFRGFPFVPPPQMAI